MPSLPQKILVFLALLMFDWRCKWTKLSFSDEEWDLNGFCSTLSRRQEFLCWNKQGKDRRSNDILSESRTGSRGSAPPVAQPGAELCYVWPAQVQTDGGDKGWWWRSAGLIDMDLPRMTAPLEALTPHYCFPLAQGWGWGRPSEAKTMGHQECPPLQFIPFNVKEKRESGKQKLSYFNKVLHLFWISECLCLSTIYLDIMVGYL